MNNHESRCLASWTEVSLPRLCANWKSLRDTLANDCGLVAVLKADAYGHGATECCIALQKLGATWFGVSSADEGEMLRHACPQGMILVMSHLGSDWRKIVDLRLLPQIYEIAQAQLLDQACRDANVDEGFPVHIELDTGMARQGICSEAQLTELLGHLHDHPRLVLEGAMTHFCSPESLDPDHTKRQIKRFEAFLEIIRDAGFKLRYIHAGNSATVLIASHVHRLRQLAQKFQTALMLRPGMALFGHIPRISPTRCGKESSLRPVLSWKTRVISKRELLRGATAGYDMTFRATRNSTLALIPVGYADGFSRHLSNRGFALIRGQKVTIAGRVSMDLTLLDVTNVANVAIGDEVTLIGEQGNEAVSAFDVADLLGTIPDEVTCMIKPRVVRTFRYTE